MRKVFKILGIVLALLVVAVLVLEEAGFRFSYKNMLYADEASTVIVKDGWVFDYLNIIRCTKDNGEVDDDYISSICPIRKYGFLYRRLDEDKNEPAFELYTGDNEEYVGMLYRYEGKEENHYFFCKESVINLEHFQANFNEEEGTYGYPVHESFIENWAVATNVIINGKEYDLYRHSYFATADIFDSIRFGECELKLVPYERDE